MIVHNRDVGFLYAENVRIKPETAHENKEP
jgi:hypothetical protein